MIRIALTGLTALALLSAGCSVATRSYGTSRSAISAADDDEDCPPGHRWSDGRCHGKGKGHDPEKHRRK